MGKRGPAGKPEHARLRQNSDYVPHTKIDADTVTAAPHEPDEAWHPIATEFWYAFQETAHTSLWARTDWMKLYLMCEQITREMNPQFVGFSEGWEKVENDDGSTSRVPVKKPVRASLPMKGASISALGQWMTTLGTTYADRLRLEIELGKPGTASGPPDPNDAVPTGDNVVDIGDARGKRKTS